MIPARRCFFILLFALAACSPRVQGSETAAPAAGTAAPEANLTSNQGNPTGNEMTDDEFDAFVEASVSELETKQEALISKWKLGSLGRYLFDQPTARLQFFDASGNVVVKASVVPIGTYSPKGETWMWAWANDSFLEPLRSQASKLRTLGQITGVPVFDTPSFTADPDMAGELAAISVKHLGALGFYRAPGPRSDVYLAIIDIGPVDAAARGSNGDVPK
jgi:hypothetical protein